MSETPFRVGITSISKPMPRLAGAGACRVLDPVPGIEYELMPDTHGVGAPEVLDRYDAVIALDYRFPAESLRLERLAVLARWGVGYDKILDACTQAGVLLAITPTGTAARRRGYSRHDLPLAKNLTRGHRPAHPTGRWRREPLPWPTSRAIPRLDRLGNIAGRTCSVSRGRLALDGCWRTRSLPANASALGVELTDLDTVMRRATS